MIDNELVILSWLECKQMLWTVW